MRLASVVLLAVFALGGCGYRFQGGGSVLPPDIKTVAIPLSEDLTTQPGAALKLTEALRQRFERYGALKVVSDPDQADAVFATRIKELDTRVAATTSETDISVGYDLVMVIDASLKRRNGQVLYQGEDLKFSEPFAGTEGVVVTSSSQFAQSGVSGGSLGGLTTTQLSRGQRDQALDDLTEEASRKLYLEAVAADF